MEGRCKLTNTYKVHIDEQAFDKKPTTQQTAPISVRITSKAVHATPEQLAQIVGQEGHTTVLGYIKGSRSNNNLVSQQVIALDFDNEAVKGVRNKGHQYTAIEDALQDPFIKEHASFIYKTFSYTDDWHKFRVVFFLDEPIADNKLVSALYTHLMAKYNGTDDLGNVLRGTLDTGTKDSARLFYGGIEAIEIDYNNTLDVASLDIQVPEPIEHEHSNDTSELSYSEAVSLVSKYAERNKKHLEDYEFYVMNHNVIKNALKTGEITQQIAETSVTILANGNPEYEAENVKKLKADRSEPKIKKSFKEWYGIDKPADYELHLAKDIKNLAEVTAERNVLEAQVNRDKILGFLERIDRSVNEPPIPTGFKQLDEILDGGIRDGLHVLGAISSLGKTTLAMQIADQIAQYGEDVLIFSLEMGTNELIAKSVSRLSLYSALEDGKPTDNAKSTNDILTGSKHADYSDYETNLIEDSIIKYSDYSENIYIHEGGISTSALTVDGITRKHKELTGNTPVVIVDYLQILEPIDQHGTEKMNTDKSVKILKQLSRDLETTVLAISSFNRMNYNTPVSMVSFKESGGIEYSADLVLGLQFSAFSDKSIDNKEIDFDEEKEKEPRKVELKILKNRNGETGKSVHFEYHAKYNMYEEVEQSDDPITINYSQSKKRRLVKDKNHRVMEI